MISSIDSRKLALELVNMAVNMNRESGVNK
jgi:hypothetical protein